MLIPRNLKTTILEAASSARVILVNGARQVGKSTIMQGLFASHEQPTYVNLDNINTLAIARSNPRAFIKGLFGNRIIIDEIQRAPELFLPIKEIVDREKQPGRFFLTGSANVLTLPKLADSLAGRMQIHTLWPISQGEIYGKQESFIDALFTHGKLKMIRPIDERDLLNKIITGGYPDILLMKSERQHLLWYQSYLTTILERDVRQLSDIEGLTALPHLLALVASQTTRLLNIADISRSLNLSATTVKRYLALLEAVFLILPLPAWAINLGKRVIKTPKLFLTDTGLLCHLLAINAKGLDANRTLLGTILENFVLMELVKQISWSKIQPKIYHWRTAAGQEVDFVLESRDGRIVGIECKAYSSFNDKALTGLKALQDAVGSKFYRGIVLYTGESAFGLDTKIDLVPISALWEITSGKAPKLTEN